MHINYTHEISDLVVGDVDRDLSSAKVASRAGDIKAEGSRDDLSTCHRRQGHVGHTILTKWSIV